MSSLLVAALLDAGAAVAHEVDKAKPRDAGGSAVQDHREAQGSGVDLRLAADGLHAAAQELRHLFGGQGLLGVGLQLIQRGGERGLFHGQAPFTPQAGRPAAVPSG